jgi:hypothetical protein
VETAELGLFRENNPEEHKASLESTLNSIFPEKQQETKAIKAKKILGDLSSSYSDEKLENLVTDFQFLADSWLDLFEKGIFEGKTIKELLNE